MASKNSKVFHRPDCKWAKRISPKNFIGFKSREEAIKKNTSNKEAIADIPKKLIKESGTRFGSIVYMVCRIIDVLDVETVGGTTKPVTKVKAQGIFHFSDYLAFQEYVLGHPEEFPQEKYVKLHLE